jgi:hypothetical protein
MKAISTIYEIGTTQFASLSIYVILKSQSRARTIIESCFKDDSASLLKSLFHFLYNAKCDTVQQFVANIVIPLYVLKKKIVRQLMMPALYIWQHQICKEQFATQTFFSSSPTLPWSVREEEPEQLIYLLKDLAVQSVYNLMNI